MAEERFRAEANEAAAMARNVRHAADVMLLAERQCGNALAAVDLRRAMEHTAALAEFLDGHSVAGSFDATAEDADCARRSAQKALGLSEAARSRIYVSAAIALLREAEHRLKLAITFLTPDPMPGASRRRTDADYTDRRGAFGDGDFMKHGGQEEFRCGSGQTPNRRDQ